MLGSSHPFYIQELKCLCGSGSKAPSLFMPAFPNCSIKSHGAAFVCFVFEILREVLFERRVSITEKNRQNFEAQGTLVCSLLIFMFFEGHLFISPPAAAKHAGIFVPTRDQMLFLISTYPLSEGVS